MVYTPTDNLLVGCKYIGRKKKLTELTTMVSLRNWNLRPDLH